jgi:hypothetical protein
VNTNCLLKRPSAPNSIVILIAASLSRLNFIGLCAYVHVFGTEQVYVLSVLTIFGTSIVQELSIYDYLHAISYRFCNTQK